MIELVVVVVIIGALAAVVVPRFVALGRDARLASLRSLAAAVQSTANYVRTACLTAPGCDYANSDQRVTIAGRSAWVNYGWLNAGDTLGSDQIDGWVQYSGFTASLPGADRTLFSLDGAPDPANCSVTYWDAWVAGHANAAVVTMTTSGC